LGRKVHPYGFRLKIIRDWQARWYAKKGPQYADLLEEDLKLRKFVQKEVGHAASPKWTSSASRTRSL